MRREAFCPVLSDSGGACGFTGGTTTGEPRAGADSGFAGKGRTGRGRRGGSVRAVATGAGDGTRTGVCAGGSIVAASVLTVPQFAPDVPMAFRHVETQGVASDVENRQHAQIAQALLNAGLIAPSDWAGSIPATIEAGLSRFTAAYQLQPGIGAFSPFELQVSGDALDVLAICDFSREFQKRFEGGAGVFAVRHGFNFKTTVAAPWLRRIESEFGAAVAGDFMGAVSRGLEFVGGWTPDDAWGWIESYDDYGDDDDETDTAGRMNPERFEALVPEMARSIATDRPRFDAAIVKAKAKNSQLVKAFEAASRVLDMIENLGTAEIDHKAFNERLMPPYFLAWTDQINPDMPDYDPCHRIYDDLIDLLSQDTGSDAVWCYGFDFDAEGDGCGTLPFAVRALQTAIPIIGAVQELMQYFDFAPPGVRGATLAQVFAEETRIRV